MCVFFPLNQCLTVSLAIELACYVLVCVAMVVFNFDLLLKIAIGCVLNNVLNWVWEFSRGQVSEVCKCINPFRLVRYVYNKLVVGVNINRFDGGLDFGQTFNSNV
jgi:hypothetical protein